MTQDDITQALHRQFKIAVLKHGRRLCDGGRAFNRENLWYDVIAKDLGINHNVVSYLLEEDLQTTIGGYFGIKKARTVFEVVDNLADTAAERAAAWRKIFNDTIARLETSPDAMKAAA